MTTTLSVCDICKGSMALDELLTTFDNRLARLHYRSAFRRVRRQMSAVYQRAVECIDTATDGDILQFIPRLETEGALQVIGEVADAVGQEAAAVSPGVDKVVGPLVARFFGGAEGVA